MKATNVLLCWVLFYFSSASTTRSVLLSKAPASPLTQDWASTQLRYDLVLLSSNNAC